MEQRLSSGFGTFPSPAELEVLHSSYGVSERKEVGYMERRLVGVLGGMGPLATVDFMQKIIEATPAECDQDHVPLIVHSVPQIPDRTEAIKSGSDEPFVALMRGMEVLESAGAALIVIPCNTAHAWFDRLAASTEVKMIHIAESVRMALDTPANAGAKKLALMATAGTVRAGFYQRYLASATREIITPAPDMQEHINIAIAAIKSGDICRGREYATNVGRSLIDLGAHRLLLACTELPIALRDGGMDPLCLDATACLAHACVRFSIDAPAWPLNLTK